ncbi:IniB N-terminal domain-containing protein [Umezawaea beigongshangensis]|uniref:IniB N-terminal domain-containing protein n=1 Tax=Umezawaea beigongshangensis TaxID=2780383 RepID=UPI0018F11A8C|nr:IniB N-terminal domain-containing protein [Umezawaea beigongshangensis]
MTSNTLHDFVLDLLSDPTALRAFQNDAEGALADAGLSDISALDVQEVIPLVLDYAPTAGLPALDAGLLETLPLDVVEDGAAGAISQLHAVTQHLSLGGLPATSELNLAAAGALTADATGLEAFGGVSAWGVGESALSADLTLAGDFSVVGDLTDTLDATVTGATATVDGAGGTVELTVDSASHTVSGATGELLPDLDGVHGDVFDSVDSLTGVVADVTVGVSGGVTNGLQLGDALDVTGLHTGSGVLDVDNGVALAGAVDSTVTTVVHDTGVTGVVSNVTTTVDGVGGHLPVVCDVTDGVTDLLF